jgi:hypothetical protein
VEAAVAITDELLADGLLADRLLTDALLTDELEMVKILSDKL